MSVSADVVLAIQKLQRSNYLNTVALLEAMGLLTVLSGSRDRDRVVKEIARVIIERKDNER